MTKNFFALISRMKNINRWVLMRNSYSENLQEHSHMTAVLAHALAVIGKEIYGKEVDPDRAASVALFHDASEILTGDMPTPVKYQNSEMMESYHRVEAMASQKLLEHLPEQLRPSYVPLMQNEDEQLAKVIKAADKLSACIKCVEERCAGNKEFSSAERQTKKALEEMDMPEVGYFMEHFMPPFGLTLDELTAERI